LKEILMNKLLIALTAGAFALGSVAALADDKTPAAPVDQAKLKAEKDAAKAAAAKMTPEEKAAAKKAKRAAKQKEETQIEKVGQPNAPAKSEALKKSVDATKGDPKPLPDAKAKQEALKETTKKAGAGQ
jgi:colicin import membrane protein